MTRSDVHSMSQFNIRTRVSYDLIFVLRKQGLRSGDSIIERRVREGTTKFSEQHARSIGSLVIETIEYEGFDD